MRKVKDFAILTGSQIVQSIVLLATSRIMTSLLSPSEMGRFSIFYAAATFLFSIFISPVGSYLQRRIVEWDRQGILARYSRGYIIYLFFCSLLAVVLFWVFQGVFHFMNDVSLFWSGVILMGLLFLTYANNYYSVTLNILGRRLSFVLCSNLTLLVGLFLSIGLVLCKIRTAEYWILGQILGQLIGVWLGWTILKGLFNKAPIDQSVSLNQRELLSEVFCFSWPLAIVSSVLWMQYQSYRFFMERINGLEVVGFFTVGYALGAKIIEKFEGLTITFYDPIFYSEIANGTREQKATAWNRYASFYFPLAVLLASFICGGYYFLAKIFFAPAFQGVSGPIILWGAVTATLASLVSLYAKVGIADLKMTGLLAPCISGTVVVLLGIFILCPRAPYWGAGISLVAGAMCTLGYVIFEMHRLLPVQFPWRRVGVALLESVPLVIVLIILQNALPTATIFQSVGVLFGAIIYLIGAAIVLEREWFQRRGITWGDMLGKKFGFDTFRPLV